ncbi:MAG: serine hydrolase [Anaerolineales bacterium]|nr:serine hydrolase [Anaerolineales bacterium]
MDRIWLTLILALCAAVTASAGPVDKSAQVEALFTSCADGEAPGASLIVIQNGEVVCEKSYGLASIELGVANTPDTVFRLGSITKQFTAMAIMQLHERGLLNIDDPVARYLPGTPHGDAITIRHLLTHTSGVSQTDDGQLEFAPGERLNYSNKGYWLLGRIIEKISGRPYEEYLRENVLGPLGMSHTGFEHRNEVIKNRASGYSNREGGGYLNTGFEDVSGACSAGALYSTVRDMCLWDQALYTDKLAKPETIELAFTPAKLNDGRLASFGFGWLVRDYRGLREVCHGGDISGFNSYIARFPDQRFTVIVLSNVGMWPAGPIPTSEVLAHRIAEIYLADVMHPASERKSITVDPAILAQYVGRYRLSGAAEVVGVMGDTIRFTVENGRLWAETKLGREELLAESETRVFWKAYPDSTAEFTRDASGKVDGLMLLLMGVREIRAERVPE